jgi:hypothetical protein
VKVLGLSDERGVQIVGFGDRGIACTESMSMICDDPQSTQLPRCLAHWLHDLELLIQWKSAGHAMRLYAPGPGASDSQLSHISSFVAGQGPGPFKGTKPRKRKATQWLDDPEFSLGLIASRLGCTPEDIQQMFHQSTTRKEHRYAISLLSQIDSLQNGIEMHSQ